MERDKKIHVFQNKVSIVIIKKGSIFFSPFFSGFAGAWNKSWISINTTSEGRWLKYTEELYSSVEIDLKKVKNLTLVKDVKNLAAPLSHNLPILVLDCPDRSLYLQSSAEKVRKNMYLPIVILRIFQSNIQRVSISGIMDELFVQKNVKLLQALSMICQFPNFLFKGNYDIERNH